MSSYEFQKRILDLTIAIALIAAFLPFWIIIPLLIYLESGDPIIFKHKRIGKDGKEFEIYKFRSMIPNADEYLHSGKDKELLKKFKQGDWKLEHDPRITKLGKVLRSLTIDEFPQLFNVLSGEMSMVGPRAYVKKELNEQTKKHPATRPLIKDILSIKPGITGPWQTSGRNEVPFKQRAKMDALYARKKSIWNDLQIVSKTPRAMISKW